MGKGRKKQPDELKLIKGTFQPCRGAKTSEKQSSEPMEAPDSLSEVAKGHFNALLGRIATLGLDSETYTEALAMAARRMEEIGKCDESIKEHGMVVEQKAVSGAVMLRANPAVSMRSEALRHLQSLLLEFGLTPSSIGKASAAGKKKEPEKKQGFGGL